MQDGISINVKNSNILSTLMTNSVIEWFLMPVTPKELYGQFSKCRCNYDIIWLTVLWIIYNQALLYETILHLIYIYVLFTGEVIGFV